MKKYLHHHRRLIGVAVLFFFTGLILGALLNKETVVVREGTPDTPAAMSSVDLMIDDGDGNIKTWNTVSWHEAMSVLGLLEQVERANAITLVVEGAEKKESKVVSIDTIKNDASAGLRWQYWVNNTYEPRGAGNYFIKPGDIVLWKYAKEQSI